CLQCYSTPYSF
nr:immunoglobulin light chain junction region [Macaca mulatta]